MKLSLFWSYRLIDLVKVGFEIEQKKLLMIKIKNKIIILMESLNFNESVQKTICLKKISCLGSTKFKKSLEND